jgi:hypothetical protein
VAAQFSRTVPTLVAVSTHSHPKVAAYSVGLMQINSKFQHTATRRWLLGQVVEVKAEENVSTHSHPKVAAPYIKKQEKSAN